MNRLILSATLSVSCLSSAPASAADRGHAIPAGTTIVIYEGAVDASSAERLTKLISANTDKIIGLKLTVKQSADADKRYYSALSKNQLNITSGDPTDAPVEVIINGGVGTTANGMLYKADGFYLIKSGGSGAAGATSFGALPVSEATIRSKHGIRLVTKSF